ncbi:MAG TPA: SRPBCC family protein [Candidatus Thermoplasmatota archaeon]|nr:SRPBCC family protein [Candidatus Thermoplasmatota archaeon]
MGTLGKLMAKQKDDLTVVGVVPGKPVDVYPELLDFERWPAWFSGVASVEVLERKSEGVGTRLRVRFDDGHHAEFTLSYAVEPSVFSLSLVTGAQNRLGGIATLLFDVALNHHPRDHPESRETEVRIRAMWSFPKEVKLSMFQRWPARTLRRSFAQALSNLAAKRRGA